MDTELEFLEVTEGTSYACGLAIDGKLYCWGEGGSNLGGGSTADTSAPVTIDSSLEVSGNHTWLSFDTEEFWDGNDWKNVCALDENHDVYCWGRGDGTLGNDTTTNHQLTLLVVNGHKFINVSVGLFRPAVSLQNTTLLLGIQ